MTDSNERRLDFGPLLALGREIAVAPHRFEALVADGDPAAVRTALGTMSVDGISDRQIAELRSLAPDTWDRAERLTGPTRALERLRIRVGLATFQPGRRVADTLPPVVAGVELAGERGSVDAPRRGTAPPDLLDDVAELRRIAGASRDDAALEILLSRMHARKHDYTFDKVAALAVEIHSPPVSEAWCREIVWAWFGNEYVSMHTTGVRQRRRREWPRTIVASVPVLVQVERDREEARVLHCLSAASGVGRVLTQWATLEPLGESGAPPSLLSARSEDGREIWIHDRGSRFEAFQGTWLVELFSSAMGDALRAMPRRRSE